MNLNGKRIAFLATDGVEQVELTRPYEAVEDAGASVDLLSVKTGSIQGMNHHDKGDAFAVSGLVGQADVADYDGLVLPGGVANPDDLRTHPEAVRFVRAFFESGKPVGAICHAPWLLVEAGVVEGVRLTSWPSLRTDLRNAGAEWVDEEAVVDGNLVTSRKPDDIPAFNDQMLALFAGDRAAAGKR